MYDHFYGNGKNHPNCLENINRLLKEHGLLTYSIIHPFYVFMNTRIKAHGKIEVLTPDSKPNDFIELKALMDLNVFIASCSVSKSACNGCSRHDKQSFGFNLTMVYRLISFKRDCLPHFSDHGGKPYLSEEGRKMADIVHEHQIKLTVLFITLRERIGDTSFLNWYACFYTSGM